MKKLSEYRRVWLERHARRAAQRRFQERARRRAKRAGYIYRRVTCYFRGRRRTMWLSAHPHEMPALLCFDKNADGTIECLSNLARNMCAGYLESKTKIKRNRFRRRWYDFSKLEEVSPSAGLILAAEFDRARILSNTTQMYTTDMEKWQAQPLRMFLSLGLLPLLGIDDAVLPPEDDAHVVRFRSDTSRNVNMAVASATLREVIGLAASAAGLVVGQDPLEHFRTFLCAIGEALNNTSDHAYPDNIPTALPNVARWWITGAVDPEARQLTFAVYDQGVTIPRAIPYGQRYERARCFVQKLTGRGYDPEDTTLDGHTIAAAVRIGVSGTREEFRGRGLPLMRSYIRDDRPGRLRIISRNGEFVACTGRKDEYRTRSVTLHGTLVEWSVSL